MPLKEYITKARNWVHKWRQPISITILLVVVALNIMIRIPPMGFYDWGLYICWIIASSRQLLLAKKAEHIFAIAFFLTTVHNLVDSIWFTYYELEWNDFISFIALLIICVIAWAVKGRPKIRFTLKSTILLSLVLFSTLFRNEQLHTIFTYNKYTLLLFPNEEEMFFRGDAILFLLWGFYNVRDTHRIGRIVSVGVLALINGNLVDELFLKPKKVTVSEYIYGSYVAYMTPYASLRMKTKNNAYWYKLLYYVNFSIHVLIAILIAMRIKAPYSEWYLFFKDLI